MFFLKKEMYWQTALYFALVDHLVQERNDRLLSQENRFLGQYLAPAKLNDLTAEYKISFMKPTKPILKRRETLTMKL